MIVLSGQDVISQDVKKSSLQEERIVLKVSALCSHNSEYILGVQVI